MEDALVQKIIIMKKADFSLNPCCSGQWSRTKYAIWRKEWQWCLNPCCNGIWSRTTDLIMATVIVNSS